MHVVIFGHTWLSVSVQRLIGTRVTDRISGQGSAIGHVLLLVCLLGVCPRVQVYTNVQL